MIFKYYTAELIMLDDGKLEIPSITIKTWRWRNPIQAVDMMKNQLKTWGHTNHRIINLRKKGRNKYVYFIMGEFHV